MRKTQFLICLMAAGISLGIAGNAHAFSICIDPGHGGTDPGALGCSLQEAEINLGVALKLRDLLQSAGHTVYMTRSTDETVSLAARVEYANGKGVDTFASIHTNSATDASATGTETFAYATGTKGYTQASNILAQMQKVWPLKNRGVKTNSLYVTKHTNMPSTLSELGFIVNCSNDATYLKSEAHRLTAAQAHCKALTQQWAGSESAECGGSGSGTVTPPPATQTGKVMGGTYLNVIKGEWLSGVTVKIGDKSVTSSTDGTLWTISDVPVGKFSLTASKAGYNTATRNDCADVVADNISWCSVALIPENAVATNGTAKGSVKDSSSGEFIAAKVQVRDGESADYDGSGNWSFSLKPGSYTISGSAAGYMPKDVTCTVFSDQESDCSILLDPKPGTITGVIYDADDHAQLLPGVVTLDTQQVAFEGTGVFSFSVPAGDYTLIAEVNGYETNTVSCAVHRDETKTCDIALKKLGQNSGNTGKGYLNGEIRSAVTNQTIPGLVLLSNGQTFNYHGAGKWMFMLDPGSYEVTGRADGYADKTLTCSVSSGVFSECMITLDPNPGGLNGHVLSHDQQIAATIQIRDESHNQIGSDIAYDGSSAWSAELPVGTYTVTAIPADPTSFKTGIATCAVTPGAPSKCNVSLLGIDENGGTLKGTVTHEGISVLTIPAIVSVSGYSSVQYSGKENEMWQIEGIPTGSYQVVARSDGYYDGNASCQVFEGETSVCHISLTPIPSPGASEHIEVGVLPTVTINSSKDCSAQPKSRHHAPFALFAIASGLLATLSIRRRKAKGGSR